MQKSQKKISIPRIDDPDSIQQARLYTHIQREELIIEVAKSINAICEQLSSSNVSLVYSKGKLKEVKISGTIEVPNV